MPAEHHGEDFLGNLSMREILVMTSRTSSSTDCRVLVGRQDNLWGRECSGNFRWREIAWQLCIGNPRFSGGGNHISDEKRDKE